MGWFDFLKKGEKLNEDIRLSEYFDAYYHSGDVYIASTHCVMRREIIPFGPQGYTTIEIPSKIKTKEKLFRYLVENHDFKLPDSSVPQENDEYISLWELNPTEEREDSSIRLYTYKEEFGFLACEDHHTICIEGDVGYEAMVLCRDYLIGKLGFVLEKELGLTDMMCVFSYKGNTFELEYDAFGGGDIFFRVNVENDKVPKAFLEAAVCLRNIDVTKYK